MLDFAKTLTKLWLVKMNIASIPRNGNVDLESILRQNIEQYTINWSLLKLSLSLMQK
jgi:hypothetical protein